ncbi:hypothetical protein Adt_23925 [Abeliophyllum distichum]|uniref:Uncharacterized protein n=1 Tax=Abeliophyllum distichum TaxID=126358 RepID=A0ABD1SCP2_9LAMI
MTEGLNLWFRHSFGLEMPLHTFQTIYQPRKLPRKKGKEEELGWYYFCPWGAHKPLVTDCPSFIKQWKESWLWVMGNWQRVVDDPEPDLDVPGVYGIASEWRSEELIVLDVDGCFGNPPKLSQPSGGSDGGPYDSKRKLKELIKPPEARIPDDVLRNLPFYLSMGAQIFKKYFSPKWEDLTFHRDLEDVPEASLAVAVRRTGMQLKVLEEVRQQMQRHKKLVAEALKSKEYKQALEGLQAAVESMCTAYKQLQADLKESDSNVLYLTKKLDDDNAAQKVTVEALERQTKRKDGC